MQEQGSIFSPSHNNTGSDAFVLSFCSIKPTEKENLDMFYQISKKRDPRSKSEISHL